MANPYVTATAGLLRWFSNPWTQVLHVDPLVLPDNLESQHVSTDIYWWVVEGSEVSMHDSVVKVPMSHRFPFEHSNEKWWRIPHTASEHSVVFPVEPGSALGNVDLCSAWDCKVHSLGTTKHAEVATGQSHLELISLQRQLSDHTDSKWTTFC